jgi:hypothetical protein
MLHAREKDCSEVSTYEHEPARLVVPHIFLLTPFMERLNKVCDISDSTTFCLLYGKKKVPKKARAHVHVGTPLVPARLNGRRFKIALGCRLFTDRSPKHGLDNL